MKLDDKGKMKEGQPDILRPLIFVAIKYRLFYSYVR